MRPTIFGLLLHLIAGAFALAQSAPLAEDAATTARVETTFLLNEKLNPFNINTNTENGMVTLTGSVDDEVTKQLAEDLAVSVKGVGEVKNNLIVVPKAYSDKDRRDWRQRISDKTTTAAVKANFLYNSEFHGLKIGVETVNGVVTLHGNVYSDAQKKRIEEIAMDARGVERVVNNLTIYSPEAVDDAIEHSERQVSDEWLEARVEAAIALNRHLSIRELDVEVDDGICFLSGNVDSPTERELAASIAQSIKGVTQIRSTIKVRDSAIEVPNAPATPVNEPLVITPPPAGPNPIQELEPIAPLDPEMDQVPQAPPGDQETTVQVQELPLPPR